MYNNWKNGEISPENSNYNLNEEAEGGDNVEEEEETQNQPVSEQQAIDAISSLNALKDAMMPMAAPKNISYWAVEVITN